jgi:Raf kinase inhibitor-like YbhB/YbcL family protein
MRIRRTVFVLIAGLFLALSFGCGQAKDARAEEKEKESDKKGDASMAITVTSTAFKPNGPIPKQYTGEGQDVSPPLAWSGVPKTAKQLALICDDPDAPRAEPWVHWVIYQIPADATGLPEGVPQKEELDDPKGVKQGVSDFKKVGYNGPLPPPGHGTHHYHFRVYALDVELSMPAKQAKKQLLDAMKGHILAQGELIGTYERK